MTFLPFRPGAVAHPSVLALPHEDPVACVRCALSLVEHRADHCVAIGIQGQGPLRSARNAADHLGSAHSSGATRLGAHEYEAALAFHAGTVATHGGDEVACPCKLDRRCANAIEPGRQHLHVVGSGVGKTLIGDRLLIKHRAYGFHSAAALIAMVFLCCSAIEIRLPL